MDEKENLSAAKVALALIRAAREAGANEQEAAQVAQAVLAAGIIGATRKE